MPKRYAIALVLATISTLLFAAAVGTEEAWKPVLANWNCDLPPPSPPSAWQAIRSLPRWLWLLAGWNGLVLFLLAARQFGSGRRMAWLPVIAFHFFMRVFALDHANDIEGVCGLHEGPSFIVVLWELAAVVLVPFYAGVLAAISAAIRRRS